MTSQMTTPIEAAYRDLISDGQIEADAAQRAAVARFADLFQALKDYRPHNKGGWRAKLGLKKGPPPKVFIFMARSGAASPC